MTVKKGKQVEIYRHLNLAHRLAGQPKKRGVKSYYNGSRLMFLEGHFDEYVALRGKSRHNFWYRLYNSWWEKYPWRLPDSEEPPADNPGRMEELSHVGEDEDREAKAEVEAKARKVSSFDRLFVDLVMNDRRELAEDRRLVQQQSLLPKHPRKQPLDPDPQAHSPATGPQAPLPLCGPTAYARGADSHQGGLRGHVRRRRKGNGED